MCIRDSLILAADAQRDGVPRHGGVTEQDVGGNGAQRGVPDPVSYTHLDVYKRQELLEDELLEEEELELLLGLGSNSNESPSSTSWYRLTRVRTVSPSLPAGVFSASR